MTALGLSKSGDTATVVLAGVAFAAMIAWLSTVFIAEHDTAPPAVAVDAPVDPATLTREVNPVALEQGRVYYAQLCVSCHGPRGDGLGEWAYRVAPRPISFMSKRVRSRTDDQLYASITEGLPNTPMIGWKRQLSDPQRRQLVVYVRYLSAGGDAGVKR